MRDIVTLVILSIDNYDNKIIINIMKIIIILSSKIFLVMII